MSITHIASKKKSNLEVTPKELLEMALLEVDKNPKIKSAYLLETRNERALPGWQTMEVWYKDALGVEECVGHITCGGLFPNPGFLMEIVDQI